MFRHGPRILVRCRLWLLVIGVVGALFVAPSSTGTAAPTTLSVTPGTGSYGGQAVRFQGDMGDGQQRIYLQRRGNTTAAWAGVIDPRTGREFSILTAANGTFAFTFPAPAMNEVYFRLHSRSADTPAHLFKSVHQDAEVGRVELDPADVPLPRGIAVNGEAYRIAVDTVNTTSDGKPTKPVLLGRQVTLQIRDLADRWVSVAQSEVKADGKLAFGPYGPGASPQEAGVYRVILETWTNGGDQVGWFPSLPFYLDLVERPAPVAAIDCVPASDSISLTWAVRGADPARIVIARSSARTAPTAPRDVVATLPGSARSYLDKLLAADQTYRYAVYTVTRYTSDGGGVYTRVPTPCQATTATPARGEG